MVRLDRGLVTVHSGRIPPVHAPGVVRQYVDARVPGRERVGERPHVVEAGEVRAEDIGCAAAGVPDPIRSRRKVVPVVKCSM